MHIGDVRSWVGQRSIGGRQARVSSLIACSLLLEVDLRGAGRSVIGGRRLECLRLPEELSNSGEDGSPE